MDEYTEIYSGTLLLQEAYANYVPDETSRKVYYNHKVYSVNTFTGAMNTTGEHWKVCPFGKSSNLHNVVLFTYDNDEHDQLYLMVV